MLDFYPLIESLLLFNTGWKLKNKTVIKMRILNDLNTWNMINFANCKILTKHIFEIWVEMVQICVGYSKFEERGYQMFWKCFS